MDERERTSHATPPVPSAALRKTRLWNIATTRIPVHRVTTENHYSDFTSRVSITEGSTSLVQQINALQLELNRKKKLIQESTFTFERGIQDGQDVISHQARKIEDLEKNLAVALDKNHELSRKLEFTESYIRSLPTQNKVTSLQACIDSLRTDIKRLEHLSGKLTQANAELQTKLQSREKDLGELKSLTQEQESEIRTLQQTIHKWNERREAAEKAGCLTLDDLLGQKMMVEEELDNLKQVSQQREGAAQRQLQQLESENKGLRSWAAKEMLRLQKDNGRCRNEIAELREQVETLLEENRHKEGQIKSLSDEIESLENIRSRWNQNFDSISRIVCKLTTCGTALRHLINGINDLCQGKDPSPSALLSDPAEADGLDIVWTSDVLTETLLKKFLAVISQLEKELRDCQLRVSQLYAQGLSSKFEPGCVTQ